MTGRPKLRVVSAPPQQRDPRCLSPLDWCALALVAAALMAGARWGGTFSTPPRVLLPAGAGSAPLFDTIGVSLILALVAAAFGVTAWREWRRKVAVGAVPGLAGSLLLLVGWVIASIVRSPVPYMSLNALASLVAVLLCGGLASRLARDRNGFGALVLAIILAGSIPAVLGVIEYISFAKQGVAYHRAFATFTNPDFLAGFLIVVLPITFSAFATAREDVMKLLLGVLLAVQSGCVLLTGSRAGVGLWLAVLAAFLVLAIVSGAAQGLGKRLAAALLIVGVSSALASVPTLSRVIQAPKAGTAAAGAARGPAAGEAALSGLQAANAAQAHSASFRRYTWTGTVRMAMANPVVGTGIGTFEVAYPRYGVTAYTSHAHNGFLQVLAETGVPGLLLLLAGLAAAAAFGTFVLLRGPRDGGPQIGDTSEPDLSPIISYLAFDHPRLLLVGLLASFQASLLHNLIDSDWYIVATAAVFASVVGLMIAQARDLAPLATQTPRPLSRFMIVAGGFAALFVLWRAGAAGAARVNEDAADDALVNGQPEAAIAAANAAASADPLDPEPKFDLALVFQGQQRSADAIAALREATRVSATGKAYYRLGQCYARSGDLPRALEAFDRAHRVEPHNTQSLRVLAETLQSAGQVGRAADTYREIVALEKTPYGTIRAMPEMVETDFAQAHAALADIAFQAGRWDEVCAEDAGAMSVLREFWTWFRRDIEVRQRTRPDRRDKVADLTEKTLAQLQQASTRLGRTADAARAGEELGQFRTQRAEYVKSSEQAGVQSEGASAQ